MLKGKTPSLIGGSNGKPRFVVALKKCECARCHGEIANGERCSDIPKLGASFSTTKRFCLPCLKKTLEKTKEDLVMLEQLLLNPVNGVDS